MSDLTLPYPNGGTSPFDSIRRTRDDGTEYWSARDLMPIMGYSAWRNFMVPIERAMKSAENQGAADHFARSRKISETKPAEDFELSRFAAYLVAMNGDPNKPEVAAAQAYFAIRTRQAETAPAISAREAGVEYAASLSRRDILTMAIEAEDRADREAAARIEAEQHARELEAPASAWKHMAAAAGDYAVGDAAKILSRDPNVSIGRDRLFAHMSGIGWVYRGQDRRKSWTAYQTQVDCGRLVEKMGKPYLNEKTGETELPAPTIRVTAKGLADLHKRLGGTDPLGVMAVAA